MATGIIKKAAKAAVKELGEDVRIDRRNMFRFPQKDQPLMEIPKGAPTVTEKTLEVAPEGVKGEKVTKSVIDTPVSRRTVIKSAGSQLAQNVVPKAAPTPQLTAQELFGSAKSMPDLYASMLPLVRKVAPEELASMADRLGFTIDDIIAMSGQDLLPRGDLTMEGMTRFEELFPITASRVLKKAGGGIIKKAAQAAAKPAARERVYHAGAEFTTPNPGLFTNPDLPAVQQFKAAMGAPRLHEFEAAPKRTGSEQDVYNVARKLGIFRPNVPAGQYLEQGENAVFAEAPRMVAELRRAGFDSLRLNDGISPQPSLVALDPAILSRPVPEQKMLQGYYRGFSGDYDAQRAAQETGKVFVTPQRPAGEHFANKRAEQTGLDPHLEMVLADPFVGRSYGLNIPIGPENKKVSHTKARQLKPEDVKSTTRLYAEGGPVAGAQFNGMVSNAMKNGMGEAEALRQLLPLFR